jgi:hypothetical protein
MANCKYTKELGDRIVAAIVDGASQKGAAKRVGIAPESLSIWKKKDPAFREAVERAHGEAQVTAETSLFRMAAKGNVNALTFWLKNRHPAEWQDSQRREITVNQTLEDWVAAPETPTSGEQKEHGQL